MMALPVASTTPSVKTPLNIAPTRVIAKLDGKEFQAYKSTVFKSLDTIITQFTSLLHMKQAKDRLNQEQALEEKAQKDQEASRNTKPSMLKKDATTGLAFMAGALAVYLSDKIKKAIEAIYDWAKSTFASIGSTIIDALKVIPFIGQAFVAGAYLFDVMKGIANQFKEPDASDGADGDVDIDVGVDDDEAVLTGVLGDATEDLQELSTRLDNVLDDLIDTSFGGIFKDRPEPDASTPDMPNIPEAPSPTHAPEGSYTPPPQEYSIFDAEREQEERMAPASSTPPQAQQTPGEIEPDRQSAPPPAPAAPPTHAPEGSQAPAPQTGQQAPPAPSAPPPSEGTSGPAAGPDKSGGKFTHPAPGYPLTSKFGPRIHPVKGGSSQHTGIDLGTPSGTPIKAAADGTATFKPSSATGGYGNMIVINHDDGYTSMYAHLQKPMVGNNQAVKQGDVVGISDNTGMSSGPHLHFEIRKNNVPVDPMSLIDAPGGNPSPDTERRAAALETGNPNATAAADRSRGGVQPVPGGTPKIPPKVEYTKVGPGTQTYAQRPQQPPVATPALSARAY